MSAHSQNLDVESLLRLKLSDISAYLDCCKPDEDMTFLQGKISECVKILESGGKELIVKFADEITIVKDKIGSLMERVRQQQSVALEEFANTQEADKGLTAYQKYSDYSEVSED